MNAERFASSTRECAYCIGRVEQRANWHGQTGACAQSWSPQHRLLSFRGCARACASPVTLPEVRQQPPSSAAAPVDAGQSSSAQWSLSWCLATATLRACWSGARIVTVARSDLLAHRRRNKLLPSRLSARKLPEPDTGRSLQEIPMRTRRDDRQTPETAGNQFCAQLFQEFGRQSLQREAGFSRLHLATNLDGALVPALKSVVNSPHRRYASMRMSHKGGRTPKLRRDNSFHGCPKKRASGTTSRTTSKRANSKSTTSCCRPLFVLIKWQHERDA
jgi:hypothetical protein